jgi:predicted DNA-binding transcriptional regulator YafY
MQTLVGGEGRVDLVDLKRQVDISYTNRRGERFTRRIEPVEGQFLFNYNEYHSAPQWLLTAIDVSGDGTLKTFAMAQIHSRKPLSLTGETPAPKHPVKRSG